MSHLEDNLMEGEGVIHRAYIHWNIYIKPVLCMVVGILLMYHAMHFMEYWLIMRDYVGLLVLVVGFIMLCRRIIDRRYSEFVVTNKRILQKTGYFRVSTMELQLSAVEGVRIDQGYIDRILNSGTLKVMGTGGTLTVFKNIEDPIEFRNNIRSLNVY